MHFSGGDERLWPGKEGGRRGGCSCPPRLASTSAFDHLCDQRVKTAAKAESSGLRSARGAAKCSRLCERGMPGRCLAAVFVVETDVIKVERIKTIHQSNSPGPRRSRPGALNLDAPLRTARQALERPEPLSGGPGGVPVPLGPSPSSGEFRVGPRLGP